MLFLEAILGIVRAISGSFTSLLDWLHPRAPDEIRDALYAAQLDSVQKHAPMLLTVAALNVVIVMTVCAHNHIAPIKYYWMSALVLYCAVRIATWFRRSKRPLSADAIPGLLRKNMLLSVMMISGLGIMSCYTFLAGTFESHLLVPISLGFGSLSIAHCFYTLRPAAIGVLVMGMVPSAVAMLAVGNFDVRMLGIAMLSVAILMIRFVAEQFDQLVARMHLEHQINALANTDPLTGLANRRAIMAALKQMDGTHFGLALLDLDGFKDINDQMGHHAGDIMLQHVSARLLSVALPSDLVGRLGGDEFIILMPGIMCVDDISARATAILAALCQPTVIDGHTVPIAASLGHAHYPADGITIDALLRVADTALYAAKRVTKKGAGQQGRSEQRAA